MAKVRDWQTMTEDDRAETVPIPRQSARRWDDDSD